MDNRPKQTSSGRLPNGHFAKGNKLSPGRPKGATCNALRVAKDAAEHVALPLLIECAKHGDVEAAKAICSYGLPKMKPVSLPCEVPTTVVGIREALEGGVLSLDDAKVALDCLVTVRKIVESEEMEQRVAELERRIKRVGGYEEED